MILFYFLISILPMERHPIWNNIVGDMTVIKYVGLACLPYALFYLLIRRISPSFFGTWQARFFMALYVLATISRFTLGGSTSRFLDHWLSYGAFLLLYFMTLCVVDSEQRLRTTLLVAIGSVGYCSLYVLREYQKGIREYSLYRPGWVVGDPNYFAVAVLACAPLAYLLVQDKTRPKWQRGFCLGSLILSLTAMMLGASRSGFLGLAASAFYLTCRLNHRVRNLVIMTVVLLVAAVVIPNSPLHRLVQPDSNDDEAVGNRYVVWRGALRMVADHPFFGVGLDNFRRVRMYVRDEEIPPGQSVANVAHNSFLDIAAELGLPALVLFLAILFFAWRTCEQVRRKAQQTGQEFLQRVALGFQAGWIGAGVANLFISAQYEKLVWLLIFLSACLPPLVSAAAYESEKASFATVRIRPGAKPLTLAPARSHPSSAIR